MLKKVIEYRKQFKYKKKLQKCFDEKFYLINNPDVIRKDIPPFEHYLLFGYHEGRAPNAWFSPQYYIQMYPDIRSESNPFLHYLIYGWKEKRLPNAFISSSFYDEVGSLNDIHHYFDEKKIANLKKDWNKKSRKPKTFNLDKTLYRIISESGLFDPQFYLAKYKDITVETGDLIEHFLEYGGFERRSPSKEFNTAFYLDKYPDVIETGLNPLVHYMLIGERQNRLINYTSLDNQFLVNQLPLEQNLPNNTVKIAVVIHAFYLDVLEDIIDNIDYITPQPDLYISVAEDADVNEVEKFLLKRNYCTFVVRRVQNRGRDIAPFIIEFGELLKPYDICCKIHGKKSLYSGSERTEWRKHLYSNLLGSKEIVQDILSAFEHNERLGLLFSDNYGLLPYWGYSWLTNKGVVNDLLKRLNMTELESFLQQTYIDYPAGSMFWFRPEAISQILSADLTYKDFPLEPIPHDGTLAHGIERIIGYTSRFNGYDFIEQNHQLGEYRVNWCHKNFNQHEAKTSKKAEEIIDNNEFIIFDIFDTLLSRPIFYPDNLFRILEKKIDNYYKITSNFLEVRKSTEKSLRLEKEDGDVSYEEIYGNIYRFCSYNNDLIEYIKREDFNHEIEILHPKKEVIKLVEYATSKNKTVLFVSDMYLSKPQIIKLLDFHHIPYNKKNIYVSADTGYRKDNSTIWQFLIKENLIEPDKALMFGDSEVSDAKIPGDFGVESFHLLSERNMFYTSLIGQEFSKKFTDINDESKMVLMGPVISHLFVSPFDVNKVFDTYERKLTPFEFGYIALGPFFYLFLNNIYLKFQNKRIFFLARDGYFLKELFEVFLKTKKLSIEKEIEYLIISRRAMLGAIEKDEENLKHIIMGLGNYTGLFSTMIYHRLGLTKDFLDECAIRDFRIVDEIGLEKAYTILSNHLQELNQHNREEKEAYLNYLDSVNFSKEQNNVLIDLGYSGTIQKYLHELTGNRLIGEYFVTTEKVKEVEEEDNILQGYFGDKVDFRDNFNVVYKYALVLEAYLTSDKGQLEYFQKTNNLPTPIYKQRVENIGTQKKITEGIKQYIETLSIIPADFFDCTDQETKNISLFTFDFILKHRLISNELIEMLSLEDDFTGNRNLNILDILNERGL